LQNFFQKDFGKKAKSPPPPPPEKTPQKMHIFGFNLLLKKFFAKTFWKTTRLCTVKYFRLFGEGGIFACYSSPQSQCEAPANPNPEDRSHYQPTEVLFFFKKNQHYQSIRDSPHKKTVFLIQ